MTEKPGVAYPPLSDEEFARYGGPPELAYLPLVNMANELIAARATRAAAGRRGAMPDTTRQLGERMAKLEATSKLASGLAPQNPAVDPLDAARDRIEFLEEHNREMLDGVARALGCGWSGDGWKDLIAAIERQGADLREAKANADTAREALDRETAKVKRLGAEDDDQRRAIAGALGLMPEVSWQWVTKEAGRLRAALTEASSAVRLLSARLDELERASS